VRFAKPNLLLLLACHLHTTFLFHLKVIFAERKDLGWENIMLQKKLSFSFLFHGQIMRFLFRSFLRWLKYTGREVHRAKRSGEEVVDQRERTKKKRQVPALHHHSTYIMKTKCKTTINKDDQNDGAIRLPSLETLPT
jgi:hypothetical protein